MASLYNSKDTLLAVALYNVFLWQVKKQGLCNITTVLKDTLAGRGPQGDNGSSGSLRSGAKALAFELSAKKDSTKTPDTVPRGGASTVAAAAAAAPPGHVA